MRPGPSPSAGIEARSASVSLTEYPLNDPQLLDNPKGLLSHGLITLRWEMEEVHLRRYAIGFQNSIHIHNGEIEFPGQFHKREVELPHGRGQGILHKLIVVRYIPRFDG